MISSLPLDNFFLAGASHHCYLQLFVVTSSQPLSPSSGIPVQIRNPCSDQLCPQSGHCHPVTQLLLPSPPHVPDFCLPPSLPDQRYSWLLWHLFLNELPTTRTTAVRMDFWPHFSSHVTHFSPWKIHNKWEKQGHLWFCLLLFHICLAFMFSYLLSVPWGLPPGLMPVFHISHPAPKMFSSADLLENTLLLMPVCLTSPRKPSKLNQLCIYLTYLWGRY